MLLNSVLDTWVMGENVKPMILNEESMCKQECYVSTQSLQTTDWLQSAPAGAHFVSRVRVFSLHAASMVKLCQLIG